MRYGLYFLFAAGMLVSSAIPVIAQTPVEVGPPKILLIVREDIRPGMMDGHSAEANSVVRIWTRANSPYHRIAMVPIAGNENEVTYLWGFNSFADLERSNKDLEKIATVTHKADFDKLRRNGDDYHSAQRDSIAVLREDLSYNPNVDIAQMRYMRVQTVRVKPGHDLAFEESRKMIKAAHEKARIDEHMAVFQVVGGAPGGTYLVFIPWKSLDGLGTIPHGKSYMDAFKDYQEKVNKISSEAIVFNDVNIYAFNPQLSYVSSRFVAVDPGFWTLKPMNIATTPQTLKKAVAKEGRKP